MRMAVAASAWVRRNGVLVDYSGGPMNRSGSTLTAALLLAVVGGAPALSITDARAGAVAQPGSPSGSSLSADQVQSQVSGLMQSIRGLREELAQARREREELLRERQALLEDRPKPPVGGNATAEQQYERNLKDWQARVNAVNERLAAKDAQIGRLEAELSALEAKLEKLQQQLPHGRAPGTRR
jgi:chromosome segregation ATPase